MSNDSIVVSGDSRAWLIEGGASPFVDPTYEGRAKVDDPSWNLGSLTPIKIPNPNKRNSFIEAGSVRGAADRVTTGIMARYPIAASDLLRLARKQCRVDVQAHIGACRRGSNPQDYLAGWAKIVVFRDCAISTYSQSNLGAISDDENNPTDETAEISAKEMYEIVPLSFGQQASAVTTYEIKTVSVCDSPDCGDCGEASDGCQRVLETMIGNGATPGTLPAVLYTDDGGATWDIIDIDTMFSNEVPSDAGCVGTYFVIISNDSHSIHYTSLDDVLAGTATFTEINDVFNAAGYPNAMSIVDPRHIWIVGDGGYIYFSSNIVNGADTQDAGVATSENLTDVHALDSNNVVAVGENNAVVYSQNGGDTWLAVTGPTVGVNLTAVWVLSADMWLVGTAAGELWATRDAGQNWTEIGLPTGTTQIDDIRFVDDVVGYIAARTSTTARILRTTDGGRDWYALPESGVSLPAADYFNQLALCESGHNTMFAAGLADDGSSGISVKGTGA